MSLLQIDRLSVSYGTTAALSDVSLSVAAGEIVALVGRSGSGKSSLGLAIPRLLAERAAIEGRICLADIDLATLDEPALRRIRGARVGLVFQEPATALNPALTIGRQIAEMVAWHRRLRGPAVATEVARLMAEVGLTVPPSRHPHALSGGQRQRVAIAIAIAARPELLIADEPTAALDVIAQSEIVELLTRLVRTRGMGLLLISHDLALVGRAADRIVVLDAGRVVEAGPARDHLADPKSAALKAMVAALRPTETRPPLGRSAPLLVARRLGRRYATGARFLNKPVAALSDVDLDLCAGETLAVVGESGSGKSTLARLVLGLDRLDAGLVSLGGETWLGARGRRLRAMRRRIQAVFQDPAASLDPRRTVAHSVAEPLHLLDAPLNAAETAERVAQALASVGLPADAAGRLPAHFSGGQRQRIALARALILAPELIVLDEALSALDLDTRAEILALLRRLQDERGIAYLFISHDLALVRGFAHRVMVLRAGRVVEAGPAAAVLGQPHDPYTQALVAASGP